MNDERKFLPSSFIPFCYFGEESIGVKLNDYEIPVCNIFKTRNYLDQLCYETNLQDLKDTQKIGKQLEMGLTLILDYNEERQSYKFTKKNESRAMNALVHNDNDVSVYLDTISLFKFKKV